MTLQANNVSRPITRSSFRRMLGREYYILRRRLGWIFQSGYVERPPVATASDSLAHTHFTHRSMILRPLKDVEMYLQHNKETNLRLAISRVNGVVIRPGERFSLWKLVGRPTARKGYLEGVVLSNGHVTTGVGGGLCQLGNLLYWMALHTDLTVTERHRHSFDVFPDVNRTVPFACGATLGYNYIDLGLENRTDRTYGIRLWIDGGYLHGEVVCDAAPEYRFEVFETDHSMRQQWWGGYTRHNRIWKRRVSLSDGAEEIVHIADNHAIMMYNPLLPG